MKVVVLTTDTPHHRYFVQQISKIIQLTGIIIEQGRATAPFPTVHPFEQLRDTYETETLLRNESAPFEEFCPTVYVQSINDGATVSYLEIAAPDVIVVFGTRKLAPTVISQAAVACLNLHGGNPEEYRGLDTHLWAIYHGDFNNLVTTLHFVDHDLDTGPLVFQAALPIPTGCEIHMLRAVNTKVCVDLVRLAILSLTENLCLPSRPQLRLGRYYSFMPAVLKESCVRRFNRFMAR